MSIQGVTVTAEMAARRRASVMAGLVVLVVLLALVSLGIGPVRLSPLTVIDALFGGGSDVQQVTLAGPACPVPSSRLRSVRFSGCPERHCRGCCAIRWRRRRCSVRHSRRHLGAVLVIAFGLADVRSWALPVAAIVAAFASCSRCWPSPAATPDY